MEKSEVRSALINARLVTEMRPYNAIEAMRAVQRIAALAPPHVEPIVHKAEQAIARSIERPGPDYDTVARHAISQLVAAMERGFLRVVK